VYPFGPALGGNSPDDVAHIIQVALAPAFLLTALATLLNVFSTRLARIADKVNNTRRELDGAGAAEARVLSRHLSYLRHRSTLLDAAVVLASLGGVLIVVAILTLFVGALRDAAAASVLFACFGGALVCAAGAIGAFLAEILLAGRGVRVEVDRQQDQASTTAGR
jgi:hypothetical protein